MINSLPLLYLLLITHFLADFFLQSKDVVKDKHQYKWKSKKLLLHALGAGILAYAAFCFSGDYAQWMIPMIIFVSHWLIDLGKTCFKTHLRLMFLIDQLLHLMIILFCWLFYTSQTNVFFSIIQSSLTDGYLWVRILAFLLLTKPSSVFIGLIVQQWEEKIKLLGGSDEKEGLENAGKWIGYLERMLILGFMLLDYYAGIGFLFAAKSIFRFGTLTKNNERALTEYIFIGTLLSFSLAMLAGILLKYI